MGATCLKDDVSGENAGQLRNMRGSVGASLRGSTGSPLLKKRFRFPDACIAGWGAYRSSPTRGPGPILPRELLRQQARIHLKLLREKTPPGSSPPRSPMGAEKSFLILGAAMASFWPAQKAGWYCHGDGTPSPVSARGAGLHVEAVSGPGDSLRGRSIVLRCGIPSSICATFPSTLSNIARLLKPGGKLMVAVPDSGGLQAVIFGSSSAPRRCSTSSVSLRFQGVDPLPRQSRIFNPAAIASGVRIRSAGVVPERSQSPVAPT